MAHMAAPPAQPPCPYITRKCPACSAREQTPKAPGDPDGASTILLACAHCPVDGEFIVYLDANGDRVWP